MLLFLLRHAEALDSQPDSERALSENGRAQVAKIARAIPARELSVISVIEHSPYRRAVETAELFQKYALPNATLRPLSNITPESDPLLLARELAHPHAETPRLIVGHNPHLTDLSSLLLSHGHGEYFFQNATCMALERYSPPGGNASWGYWRLLWHVTSDFGETPRSPVRA